MGKEDVLDFTADVVAKLISKGVAAVEKFVFDGVPWK